MLLINADTKCTEGHYMGGAVQCCSCVSRFTYPIFVPSVNQVCHVKLQCKPSSIVEGGFSLAVIDICGGAVGTLSKHL